MHLIESKGKWNCEFLFDNSIVRVPPKTRQNSIQIDRLTFNGRSIVSVASCAGADRRTNERSEWCVNGGTITTTCNDTRVLEPLTIVIFGFAFLLLLVLFIVLIIVCLTRWKYTQIKSSLSRNGPNANFKFSFFLFLRFLCVWTTDTRGHSRVLSHA